MAIESKKLTIGDKVYRIKQHPATEGCKLIEKYFNAIRAFMLAQDTQYIYNKAVIPFAAKFEGYFLALCLFMDRLAVDEPYVMPPALAGSSESIKLTVREVLAGKTLEDRPQASEQRQVVPMSYNIDYKATQRQDDALDYEAALGQFLKYITLDGEPVEMESLSFLELAVMLGAFIEYNVLHLWTKDRWNLPQNYSAGGLEVRSLQAVAKGFSQSNVIYNILNCSKPLATMTDLSLYMSAEDAYDANESALRMYYEEAEVRKKAERQSKNN